MRYFPLLESGGLQTKSVGGCHVHHPSCGLPRAVGERRGWRGEGGRWREKEEKWRKDGGERSEDGEKRRR